MPSLRKNSERVINWIVCAQLDYIGEAQFPWATPEDHDWQYIQVREDALGSHRDFSASTISIGTPGVHEMGHYFGLLHVFGSPLQYNSGEFGYSCDGPGDYVGDTAVSKRPTSVLHPTCDAAKDSCPDQPGLDEINNVMDG